MDQAVTAPTPLEPASRPSPVRVKRLGHVVIQVRDLERSVRFYTEIFNFRVSDDASAGGVFLTGRTRRSPPRGRFACITSPWRLNLWTICSRSVTTSRSAASRLFGKAGA